LNPETRLIEAVNKRLPKRFHSQSLTYASQSCVGTPDRYYDPEGGNDLWAEYKQLKAMPRSRIVIGEYSPMQIRWMTRRYNNSLAHGRPNIVGIVGLPNRKACIQQTPTEWREGSPVETAMDLEDIAAWITAFCFRSFGS